MAAGNGVPIRLVHDDGLLTEISATSMTLTTQRKTGGMATPFSGGQRMGVDLNMNKGLMNIQAILTDDINTVGSNIHATSSIDFSLLQPLPVGNVGGGAGSFMLQDNFDKMFTENTIIGTHSNLKLQLTSSLGDKFIIKFKAINGSTPFTNPTNATEQNNFEIGVSIASEAKNSRTSADFVSKLHNLIQNTTILAANFTATIASSAITSVTNSVLIISQDKEGSIGNNKTPNWITNNCSIELPLTNIFTGGLTVQKRSAGDKAMDLYGIMNNSKKSGRKKQILGVGLMAGGAAIAVVGAIHTAGASVAAGSAIASTGAGLAFDASGYGSDYIVGIQIPYNSAIQADNDTYVARNFIMPTGWNKTRKNKGSEGNNNPAGIEFSGNETGIKGTVNKLDISYNAGENIYQLEIQFVPVDRLL